jgi:DNA-binding transcriptional ArsR family regulator
MSKPRLTAIREEIDQLEAARGVAADRIRELKLEAGELVLSAGAMPPPAASPKKRSAKAAISPTDSKVLDFLTMDEQSAGDIATGIGAAESTVRQSLGKLFKAGLIAKPGQGRYTRLST